MTATPAAPAPPRSTSSPLVEAILSGKASVPARLAAARGALPVTLPERLLLCVQLCADPDASVRQAAGQRLAGEGRDDLVASLQARESLAPEVLEHFARRSDLEPAVLEKLALESGLSNTALEELARCPHPSVLERIVINQTRLLADPEIVRRLDANPRMGATGRRLLAEFKHDFWERRSQDLVLSQPEAAAPGGGAETAAEAPAGEEPGAETAPPDGAEAPEAPAPEITPEEASDKAFKAAYVRIMTLSVPEKIQLAVKATREERTVLVRDSNRQVASAVLKSPKLSDQEVDSIANMRNISDEVLRIIATHKNWTRNYSVIHALCRNPKTPVGLSLPFLNRLNTRDLKSLLTDKNISEAVRRMTKKVFDQRNQAAQPAFKKK